MTDQIIMITIDLIYEIKVRWKLLLAVINARLAHRERLGQTPTSWSLSCATLIRP